MGMYTEMFVAINIKGGSPRSVVEVLKYMTSGDGPVPDNLPDHPLFDSGRWSMLMRCSSYYFPGEAVSAIRFDDISQNWHLTARANLKNYGGEIELFMDWIAPHLDALPGDFVGFSRYEETEWPTLWHMGEDGNIHPTVTAARKEAERGE